MSDKVCVFAGQGAQDVDGLGALEVRQPLAIQPLTSEQEISDSLPAVYHFGQLPFEDGTPFGRAQFQRDCISCHS